VQHVLCCTRYPQARQKPRMWVCICNNGAAQSQRQDGGWPARRESQRRPLSVALRIVFTPHPARTLRTHSTQSGGHYKTGPPPQQLGPFAHQTPRRAGVQITSPRMVGRPSAAVPTTRTGPPVRHTRPVKRTRCGRRPETPAETPTGTFSHPELLLLLLHCSRGKRGKRERGRRRLCWQLPHQPHPLPSPQSQSQSNPHLASPSPPFISYQKPKNTPPSLIYKYVCNTYLQNRAYLLTYLINQPKPFFFFFLFNCVFFLQSFFTP
jgi:hypothetical protein